jgi:hypothetical protein
MLGGRVIPVCCIIKGMSVRGCILPIGLAQYNFQGYALVYNMSNAITYGDMPSRVSGFYIMDGLVQGRVIKKKTPLAKGQAGFSHILA